MLKLIQITDCHLRPPGETMFDLDPAARLAAAIADVNRRHPDAALCVLTGDLANDGDPAAYALLRRLLAELTVPWTLVPGNHDDRDAVRRAFPEVERDADGFLQSIRSTPEGLLLFLDTVDPGVHSGAYCARRLAWLKGELEAARGRPAYLFMHHPPVRIGMPRLDQYRLLDAEAFGAVLGRFPNVRHLFFGHVHRAVSGTWRGIGYSALPGTNHQNALDFADARENLSSHEPPAYAVILLDAETTVVHLHAFLYAGPHYVYDPDAPVGVQIRRLKD